MYWHSDSNAVRDESVLDVAPQLAQSSVRLYRRHRVNEDASWFGVKSLECPEGIYYRVGWRHEYLMAQNSQQWASRRYRTLVRLLIKRLAREVAE